jgi:DNA-binding response OmpR family regulator
MVDWQDEQRVAHIPHGGTALHLILKLDGYEVRIAENGRFAIEIMQTFQPRLIIMDWHMPGHDTS